MMLLRKTALAGLLLFSAPAAQAQFKGTWYSFRLDELVFCTISDRYVATGRIGHYGTDREYATALDTLKILKRRQVGDSLLYLITGGIVFGGADGEPSLSKFRFDRRTGSLETFYFGLMARQLELRENSPGRTARTQEQLMRQDTSTRAYVQLFSKDSVDRFLAYPRAIDQPAETIVALYSELCRRLEVLRAAPESEGLPYSLMRGWGRAALESPVYLKYRTRPLVSNEGDEYKIREKYKADTAVQAVLSRYLELRHR